MLGITLTAAKNAFSAKKSCIFIHLMRWLVLLTIVNNNFDNLFQMFAENSAYQADCKRIIR